MSLETYTGQTSALVATNPADTDPKSEGAAHMRGIKKTLLEGMITTNGAVNSNPAAQVINGTLQTNGNNLVNGGRVAWGDGSAYIIGDATSDVVSVYVNNVQALQANENLIEINGAYSSVLGQYGATKDITCSTIGVDVPIDGWVNCSGLLSIRDATTGGTDVWIIDPNAGALRIAGNGNTGGLGFSWSSGWFMRVTQGAVPRNFTLALLGIKG